MICKKSLLTVMGSGFFISDTLIVPFTKEPSKVDFYPLQSERNCLLYVSGSLSCVEQVSTTVPKSAILRFCPSRETCWGVPSPNPALRLAPQKDFRPAKSFFSLSPRKWLTDKSIFVISERLTIKSQPQNE